MSILKQGRMLAAHDDALAAHEEAVALAKARKAWGLAKSENERPGLSRKRSWAAFFGFGRKRRQS